MYVYIYIASKTKHKNTQSGQYDTPSCSLLYHHHMTKTKRGLHLHSSQPACSPAHLSQQSIITGPKKKGDTSVRKKQNNKIHHPFFFYSYLPGHFQTRGPMQSQPATLAALPPSWMLFPRVLEAHHARHARELRTHHRRTWCRATVTCRLSGHHAIRRPSEHQTTSKAGSDYGLWLCARTNKSVTKGSTYVTGKVIYGSHQPRNTPSSSDALADFIDSSLICFSSCAIRLFWSLICCSRYGIT